MFQIKIQLISSKVKARLGHRHVGVDFIGGGSALGVDVILGMPSAQRYRVIIARTTYIVIETNLP